MSQSFSSTEKLEATIECLFPSDAKTITFVDSMVLPSKLSNFAISSGVGGTISNPLNLCGRAM